MNHEAYERRRQLMLQQGYIAVREICTKLGYTPGAGIGWVNSGTLSAIKMHNAYYVPVKQAMLHFGRERWVKFGLPLPLGAP